MRIYESKNKSEYKYDHEFTCEYMKVKTRKSEYKYDYEFTCEYMKVKTRVNINMIMNLHANI